MKYRPAKGVALYSICGSYYLLPSISSGIRMRMNITVPDELLDVLRGNEIAYDLSTKTKDKIRRLLKLKYIEEYDT